MDTQTKQELERLYGLAKSATTTTNFYNQVYKYIGYINQSPFLVHILEEDDRAMHIYDLEKHSTTPKQQDGESWSAYFLKTMAHMNSGEHHFVSHLFFLLNHHIFDLLDWYYTDDFQSNEASVMLNGREKVRIFDKLQKYFNSNPILHNEEDFNKKYIGDFQTWKSILINFHTKLLEKIDETPQATESTGEIILELHTGGYFKYLNKEGNINPKINEYKLLHMLIKSGKNPVHYSSLAKEIFNKDDSPSLRRDIQQLIKKLKLKLFIQSSSRHKLIESSQNYGYHLALKGDERAIIVP